MVAYSFRPPAGIPGTVTRLEHAVIEPQFILASAPPSAYGQPCVIDTATGKLRAVTSTDTATAVFRFLVRVFPGLGSQDPLGVSTVGTSGTVSAMRRGYMQVLLSSGVATKDGPVYVRIAGASSGKPIGGLEAAADATPANTLLIPDCVFYGPADANGITEIAFKI